MPPIEIRIKRGTASYLADQNEVLASGEPCLEVDTGKIKYGDGITPWNQLAYAVGADVSGTNNEVTGTDGFAGGGSDNLVSGVSGAVVGGQNNSVSGSRGFVAGGQDNSASASNAAVIGGSGNAAEGAAAVVIGGTDNSAAGANSVAFGIGALATKSAQVAFSGGNFEEPGDAQFSIYHLRAYTENATPTRMYVNGASENLILSPGTAWAFEVRVVAYDEISGAAATWIIRGGISRDFSNNTELSGPPITESLGDEWADTSNVQVSADNTNEAMAVTVTGVSGRTIRWYATVMANEVTAGQPLVSDMFVEIIADGAISSLGVSVGSGQLQPAFSTSVTDYVVYSNAGFYDTSSLNYSVTINGGSPVTGTATVNKALRIRSGSQDYFVRILPSDFPQLLDVQTKTAQYIPGYYLLAFEYSPYFAVYDSNGVPVWYTHTDPSLQGVISLHAGWEPNRLMTNGWTHNGDRWDIQIGLNTMTAKPYTMINPDTRGGFHTWEVHEAHAIKAPANRKGNILYQSYDSTGFYIQEQNPQNQIVWEWWSDDYFNTTYSDYFHVNSLDVHPVTGNIVVSARHNGAIFAIDYATKNLIWVFENNNGDCYGGPLFPLRKTNTTANTKWLTPFNEPTIGTQYTGTDSQHDARWHTDFSVLTQGNDIVSVSDNQSCSMRPARGVIYEIDLVNNRAIFRSQVYSPLGSTPWRGSFTLLKELNGSFSHVCCFPAQNPNLVEFSSDASGNGTQNITFEMYTQQWDHYRCIKVRPDFLNINYMRTTAGRSPTIV